MGVRDGAFDAETSRKRSADADVEMNNFAGKQKDDRATQQIDSPVPSSASSDTSSLNLSVLGGTSRDSYLPLRGPKWLRTTTPNQPKLMTYLQNSKLRAVIIWLSGPSPPRRCTFQPLFPKAQSWIFRKVEAVFPGGTYAAVALVLSVWLTVFAYILATSTQSTEQAVHLSCTSRLWYKAPYCGLNGDNCQPFEGAGFTFSCPSQCAAVQVLEPYTIGDQEINYRNLVVGGPTNDDAASAVYRGDSWICPAAVHAGLISNTRGGCARLTRLGQQRHFASSERNDIRSVGFLPEFPLAFSFSAVDASCGDPQWKVFTVSFLAVLLIALIAPNPGVFFCSVFVIVFFQVGLASDSPYFPRFGGVLSATFQRFLPAAFVGYVLYHFCLQRTLSGNEAYIEKAVLWVGGCWVGALNSYTFDRIPISRLTGHDLKQQPGAITALIIILLFILGAAIGQAWYFRLEGRLLKLLGFYLVVGVVMGCLAAVPLVELRIHHYIIGLLLLPGTSLQTRPSMLYQGLLLGLFINGVARWGFASVLETAEALRGEGQSGSMLPMVLTPVIETLTAKFTLPQIPAGFDGISVLVNDVERLWQANTSSLTSFTWNKTQTDDPVFFRFAFTKAVALGGKLYGDYTKPGTWFTNGSWSGIAPGPSR